MDEPDDPLEARIWKLETENQDLHDEIARLRGVVERNRASFEKMRVAAIEARAERDTLRDKVAVYEQVEKLRKMRREAEAHHEENVDDIMRRAAEILANRDRKEDA